MKHRAQPASPSPRPAMRSVGQILCVLALLPFVVFAAPLDRFVQLPACCRSGCDDDGCPIGASRQSHRAVPPTAHGHETSKAMAKNAASPSEVSGIPSCHGAADATKEDAEEAAEKGQLEQAKAGQQRASSRAVPTETNEARRGPHPRLAWTSGEKCPQECCGTTSAQRIHTHGSAATDHVKSMTELLPSRHEERSLRERSTKAQPRGPPVG